MTELETLSEVLRKIVADNGAEAPLRICQAVVEALPVDGAAITLMSDPDHQEPVCATDDAAVHLDEVQFSLAQGPCIDAYSSGQPVLVPDIADIAEERWPLFAEGMRHSDVRAVYALPLHAGVAKLGVFDLYRRQRGSLHGDDLTGALRAADAAMWSVLDVRITPTLESAERLHGILQAPLHWAEVHQATGMLIAQLGISGAEALARLRAYAFAQDRPLNDVAHDIVARTLRLHDEDQR